MYCRPMNDAERAAKSYAVVSCTAKEVIVKERPVEKHTKTFCFDRVFGPDSKQVYLLSIIYILAIYTKLLFIIVCF